MGEGGGGAREKRVLRWNIIKYVLFIFRKKK